MCLFTLDKKHGEKNPFTLNAHAVYDWVWFSKFLMPWQMIKVQIKIKVFCMTHNTNQAHINCYLYNFKMIEFTQSHV